MSHKTLRKEIKDSIKLKTNKKEAKRLIIDPKEAIIFQTKKASGYSVYLRGKPCKPAKCKGKNVKFTPKNININTDVIKTLSNTKPVIKVNQKVAPAKIPKTAPRLNT